MVTLGGMVEDFDFRGGGVPGAVARFVLALGAQVGLVLGGAWALVTVDRLSDGNPVARFVIAVASCGALVWSVAWTARDLDPPTGVIAVLYLSAAAVLLGGAAFGLLTWLWSDQQVLHDRGVTVPGVVGRHWQSGNGAGLDPGPLFYYNVVGPDGSHWSFRTETAGQRPDVGEPVTLTVDPEDEVRPQRGDRPDAPPWGVATGARDAVFAGALVLAVAAAAPRR
ncbi:hypothetical protein [Streptomyces sp. CB03911]|nr:hypothetical protein [Streptomyces sp. CB03911]